MHPVNTSYKVGKPRRGDPPVRGAFERKPAGRDQLRDYELAQY